MTRTKATISILFLLTIVACDKEINIYIPESKVALVANSVFSQDATFKLHLTKSNSGDPVTNASIEIFNNEKFIGSVPHFDSSLYKSSNLSLIEGVEYNVKISTPSYPDLYSVDCIPFSIPFTDLKHYDSSGINKYQQRYASFEITFSDPKEENNYYELSVIREVDTSNLILIDSTITDFIFNGVSLIQNEKNKLARSNLTLFSSDQSILAEGFLDQISGFGLFQENLFFNDDLFDGQTKSVQINYLPYYSGAQGRFRFLIPERKFKIILRSISENYYTFRKTQKSYTEYRSEAAIWKGAGDYVQVFSNIENGYGLYAAYSLSIDSIMIMHSFENW